MENLTELERREISVSDQGAFARVWEEAAGMQRRYFLVPITHGTKRGNASGFNSRCFAASFFDLVVRAS
jgi:hypothetical protein